MSAESEKGGAVKATRLYGRVQRGEWNWVVPSSVEGRSEEAKKHHLALETLLTSRRLPKPRFFTQWTRADGGAFISLNDALNRSLEQSRRNQSAESKAAPAFMLLREQRPPTSLGKMLKQRRGIIPLSSHSGKGNPPHPAIMPWLSRKASLVDLAGRRRRAADGRWWRFPEPRDTRNQVEPRNQTAGNLPGTYSSSSSSFSSDGREGERRRLFTSPGAAATADLRARRRPLTSLPAIHTTFIQTSGGTSQSTMIQSKLGKILGGVVVGVVLIGLLCVIGYFIWRDSGFRALREALLKPFGTAQGVDVPTSAVTKSGVTASAVLGQQRTRKLSMRRRSDSLYKEIGASREDMEDTQQLKNGSVAESREFDEKDSVVSLTDPGGSISPLSFSRAALLSPRHAPVLPATRSEMNRRDDDKSKQTFWSKLKLPKPSA